MKTLKTILFLNLRFADFYSGELFKRVKEEKKVRLVAILDQQFNDKIGEPIAPYLDQVNFLHAEPKNGFLAEFSYESLRKLVSEEVKKSREVRIVCTDEFNLLNAGRLRREFGLKGHTDHDLLCYRDKMKMKGLLAKAGIRVPRFKLFDLADSFDYIVSKIGLPFIAKPVDSSGSHGVKVIRNESDYQQCKAELAHQSAVFQLEEFIEGKLFHVDSCIKNNGITFICANEYTCPNHEYAMGKTLGSFPLDKYDPYAIRLIHFAKKCLKALGANNVVNHMELFVTHEDEIIFLEVSGRPPGGLLNLTHQINFGVNLVDEDFFLQSGLDLVMEYEPPHQSAFFALFPLFPGKVVKLNHPCVKSRYQMTWHVARGEAIAKEVCGNIMKKSAHAIFYHEDKAILKQDFDVVKHHQAIEVSE